MADPSNASARDCMHFMGLGPVWVVGVDDSNGNDTGDTNSTRRGSITSVTTGRPYLSPVSRRILRPSSPMPWKLYGFVRGL